MNIWDFRDSNFFPNSIKNNRFLWHKWCCTRTNYYRWSSRSYKAGKCLQMTHLYSTTDLIKAFMSHWVSLLLFQVSWRTTWSSTSWGVTVCWKVSGSAGKVSPAGSSTVTSSRGTVAYSCASQSTSIDSVLLMIWFQWIFSDTKYWMLVSSLMDSSSTTRRPQWNCWSPSM